jgi:hypothetical protein
LAAGLVCSARFDVRMSDAPEPRWELLPHDPLGFFGMVEPIDPVDLRRRYNGLLRRYRPERSPHEFQLLRAAYDALRGRAERPLFVAAEVPSSAAGDATPTADLARRTPDSDLVQRLAALRRDALSGDLAQLTAAWADLSADALHRAGGLDDDEIELVGQLLEYRRHRDDLRRQLTTMPALREQCDALVTASANADGAALDSAWQAWSRTVAAAPERALRALPIEHPALAAGWASFGLAHFRSLYRWPGAVDMRCTADVAQQILARCVAATKQRLRGRMYDEPGRWVVPVAILGAILPRLVASSRPSLGTRLSWSITSILIALVVWGLWRWSPWGKARMRALHVALFRDAWRAIILDELVRQRVPFAEFVSELHEPPARRLADATSVRQTLTPFVVADAGLAMVVAAAQSTCDEHQGAPAD